MSELLYVDLGFNRKSVWIKKTVYTLCIMGLFGKSFLFKIKLI